MNPSDFDRDDKLGRALRDALTPDYSDAFAARVMARVPSPRRRTWDTLSNWSAWGVASAATVAAVALLVTMSDRSDASIENALTPNDSQAVAQIMVDDDSPGADVLFLPDEVIE